MKANKPFQFVTASYLVRIGNQESTSLLDLQHGIESCSDASIFYHTFQSLGRHHFLTEGFSNDFAEWAFSACNRPALAEQLASLDIRDYVSLADLRGDLRRIVGDYCQASPREAQQAAFESFYFCETVEEEVPLGFEAWTLEEFRDGLSGSATPPCSSTSSPRACGCICVRMISRNGWPKNSDSKNWGAGWIRLMFTPTRSTVFEQG